MSTTHKHTAICPKCKITKRCESGVRCHRCQNEMIVLSYRIRVPKRKKWSEFLDFLSELNPYYKSKIENYGKRENH